MSLLSDFDTSAIAGSLGYLFLDGMQVTVTITLVATLGGLLIGTGLAMLRLARIPVLSKLAAVYVNTVRALPLILVLFWFFFLMPFVMAWLTGASRPVRVGGYVSALVTFTLFEAAYFSEIMRAGIQAIPRGQVAAGQALGLGRAQVMIWVVLPQALRNMTPVILTQSIILFQDTSLVYVLGLTDFFGAASKIAQRDGAVVEMYLFAALVYFIICFTASMLVRRLQARIAILR